MARSRSDAGSSPAARVEEPLDLLLVSALGRRRAGPGGRTSAVGSASAPALVEQEAVQAAHGRQGPGHRRGTEPGGAPLGGQVVLDAARVGVVDACGPAPARNAS